MTIHTLDRTVNGAGAKSEAEHVVRRGRRGTIVTKTPVQLEPLTIQTLKVTVEGTSPFIAHAWSEKAKKQMLARQQGVTAKKQREKRDPEAEFEAARYRINNKVDGIPATAFKSAIVDAARHFEGDGVAKADLQRTIFVIGEGPRQLVPIITGKPTMREDIGRLADAGRTANLIYRPEYWPWAAVLSIQYLPSQVTADSIVALVDAAGRFSGVGEWRPSAPKSRSGSYGRFRVRVARGGKR